MSASRLSLALDAPGALPPEGRILVIASGAAGDLAPLAKERCVVVEGMRPAHDALTAAGWSVVPEIAEATGDFAAALVLVPRARAAARAAVAEAARRVRPGGAIWIDGQKTDGIDALSTVCMLASAWFLLKIIEEVNRAQQTSLGVQETFA